MNWTQFLRNVVFGGSAFAAGVLFALAMVRAWRWLFRGHHKRDLAAFMMDLGCAGVIYEVLTQIIARAPELPANAVTAWYITFLSLTFFGGSGLLWEYLFGDEEATDAP